MKKALSLVSTLIGGVMVAAAQTGVVGAAPVAARVDGGTLLGILSLAQTIVSRLVPFAIGLAVVVFFWYLIKFIMQGGQSANEKDASIKGMGYSVLALFVMVSIWGIINVIGSTLGVSSNAAVPTVGVPTGPQVTP